MFHILSKFGSLLNPDEMKNNKYLSAGRGGSTGIVMEYPGELNVLKYANAVRLKWYSSDKKQRRWIRADLKYMDDINGANTIDIADISRGSEVLAVLVDILRSSDTDWMKYDSPGEEEWYVLPSLLER